MTMTKVYMIRHQAHGYLPQLVFSEPPSAEQMSLVARYFASLHGTHHPKLETEYWTRIVEVPVFSSSDELPVKPQGEGKENVAALRPMTVSGEMHVTPPKK
jgi:hypothetical protein